MLNEELTLEGLLTNVPIDDNGTENESFSDVSLVSDRSGSPT